MPRQCSLLQTLFVTAALLMPTGRAFAQSPQVLTDFTSSTARFPAAALLLGSDAAITVRPTLVVSSTSERSSG
jgi:hypothetical protein